MPQKQRNSTRCIDLCNDLIPNGYLPIPLVEKGPVIKGWSTATIDEDWIKAQFPNPRANRFPNTGLRCDDLIAFDIDILDQDLAEKAEGIIEDTIGPTDLCRYGNFPKRLLVYVREGPDMRSMRTGKYNGHQVEVLAGSGRQFAAFGTHPKGMEYEWDTKSPLDTRIHELPPCTPEQATQALDLIEEMFEDEGFDKQRSGYTRGSDSTDILDLTDDFAIHLSSGAAVTWAELKPTLTEDGVWGNIEREDGRFGDSGAVHFFISKGTKKPCAHDFVRDVTHWEPTGNGALKGLPPPTTPSNTPPSTPLNELLSKWVLLYDKTMRHIDDPTRSYKVDAVNTANMDKQIPIVGTNRTRPLIKEWLMHPDTLKAHYAALRPDHPDAILLPNGPAVVFNTYRAPLLPPEGGEYETFLEFLEHLVPGAMDRQLVLDWLAKKVQQPGLRMHGLVMVTEEFGTGRGTLFEIVRALFGARYVVDIELRHLLGTAGQADYNDYLERALIVTVQEALQEDEKRSKWQSRHLAYERIKAICDPASGEVLIRRKGIPNSHETVYASILISSNHTDALAIEEGDRRLIVVDNGTTPLAEAGGRLYERIHEWRANFLNIGALFRYLMGWDASGYDAYGQPPMTQAKRHMIDLQSNDVDYLFDEFRRTAKGDICTYAQWKRFLKQNRTNSEYELPTGDALDRQALAIIRKKACRFSDKKMVKIKVGGVDVRPWIIRDTSRWRGGTSRADARAEIEKNGDPGGKVLQLPER